MTNTYNHAVDAADWCRAKDEFGTTNFQRLYHSVSRLANQRGKVSITTDEIRKMTPCHVYTSSLMRWLIMTDWKLCEYLRIMNIPDLDDEGNAEDFARLYSDFGTIPRCANHVQAKNRWLAYAKSLR